MFKLARCCWLTQGLVMLVMMGIGTSAYALLPVEQDTIAVFRHVAPLVVNVHRYERIKTSYFDSKLISTGAGSGFIWNKKGYVVTNYHVVKGAKHVAVTLGNGNTFKAKVVGADRLRDVALLKLTSLAALKQLPQQYLPLGQDDHVRVGQVAIAIGTPYGLSQTLTVGVVSAINRLVPGVNGIEFGMIQTDASINPGNSGGPLLDSQGYLIGMNSMIFSKHGGFTGIGFAIPIDAIERDVKQLIATGHVAQPGIGIVPLSDQLARQANIKGVVIAKVLPHFSAARQQLRGLQQGTHGQVWLGDVIVAVDGQAVSQFSELVKLLANKTMGNTVELTLLRGKKTIKKQLKIMDVSPDVAYNGAP